jgi:hypothetical protein
MHWKIRSATSLLFAWLRALSDRRRILFGSFPYFRDAFDGDDLPLSFILRRDSHRRGAGNGKRHDPMPEAVLKGTGRDSGIHLSDRRVHVRSALRPNADHRDDHRVT